MNAPSITVTPVLVADLHIEGERMPVYVHVIDHPDARVLVDTGMTEQHPLLADMDPRLSPLTEQDIDIAGIDLVVNTHLHADHCGGNHLFAGKPTYVQRQELDDARTEDDYTIREWVEAPGVRYVPVDGESSSCSSGSDLSQRRATHPARRSSLCRPTGVRSSSAVTWRSGSANSTSPGPKANCSCARSTPNSSGSRTPTSRGDPTPPEPHRPERASGKGDHHSVAGDVVHGVRRPLTCVFGGGAKGNRTPDLFHAMHTTNRLSRPTASREGHPRPIVSDRHAGRNLRRQHVNRPMRPGASNAVAHRPAASRRSRMATLLATSPRPHTAIGRWLS
jgi:hypothetical protein